MNLNMISPFTSPDKRASNESNDETPSSRVLLDTLFDSDIGITTTNNTFHTTISPHLSKNRGIIPGSALFFLLKNIEYMLRIRTTLVYVLIPLKMAPSS